MRSFVLTVVLKVRCGQKTAEPAPQRRVQVFARAKQQIADRLFFCEDAALNWLQASECISRL